MWNNFNAIARAAWPAVVAKQVGIFNTTVYNSTQSSFAYFTTTLDVSNSPIRQAAVQIPYYTTTNANVDSPPKINITKMGNYLSFWIRTSTFTYVAPSIRSATYSIGNGPQTNLVEKTWTNVVMDTNNLRHQYEGTQNRLDKAKVDYIILTVGKRAIGQSTFKVDIAQVLFTDSGDFASPLPVMPLSATHAPFSGSDHTPPLPETPTNHDNESDEKTRTYVAATACIMCVCVAVIGAILIVKNRGKSQAEQQGSSLEFQQPIGEQHVPYDAIGRLWSD